MSISQGEDSLISMKFNKAFTTILILVCLLSGIVQPSQIVLAEEPDRTTFQPVFFSKDLREYWKLENIPPAQAIVPPNDPNNVVYLTFDDGPDPNWSIQILDILDRYHARATFYMIGYNVVSYPEVVREVASRGQTIGIHGFNHTDLSGAGYTFLYNEIHDTESAIMEALQWDQELIKQVGRCLRPPYGNKSNLLVANAEAMGYEISMWNIDTNDWSGKSPEEIFTHFTSSLEPQKVILMHDGGLDRSNTVKALELMLHELMMEGYTVLPYCTQDGQAIKN